MDRKAQRLAMLVLGVLTGITVYLVATPAGPSRPAPPALQGPRATVIPESGLAQATGLASEIQLADETKVKEFPRQTQGPPHPRKDPPASDTEWFSMRVEKYNLTQYLITSVAHVHIRKLMRHQELNPRDQYFDPEKRQELKDLMRP